METTRVQEKHGHSNSPTYKSWQNMLDRCSREGSRYKANGVTVCEQWKNSFATFLKDMGVRPSRMHTIERRDNSGNYEPGNCRWATYAEQNRNVSRNVVVEFDGKRMCLADWDLYCGFPENTIGKRIRRGWSFEKAVSTSYVRPQFLSDLSNRRFGRVVAQSFAGKVKGRNCWNCRCDCGEMHVMRVDVLLRGTQPECKCQR